ncbi:hypothetical protein AALP_AA6G160600 [Arabis alpina]|uniref:RNase H type-1 domain-containing protein n=1 Tax=Arabis alpina TaxID=50452 RepID=A0A087GPJ9_ARAAL|nr:hypothetical protein AALP_AA6G160600 [Arabis alpina]
MANIGPYVPEEITLQLRSLVVDTMMGAKDKISWSGNSDGKFTVKSAYSMLTRNLTLRQDLSRLFQRVWALIVPERVRIFIWLGVHKVLMTNVERQRRHLTSSGVCEVCRGSEETIMHILWDCPAMEGIWRRFVPPRKQGLFFTQTLLEWLYTKLGDDSKVGNSIWKCRDRLKFLKDLALEVTSAHNKLGKRQSRNQERIEHMIKWQPPRDGWVKLNTDGASRGNPGLAAAGGVLRDGDGNWCGGFVLNIGICFAPLAELWGVYYGLYIAWERRITRLEIEVDSAIVVEFLKTGISEYHPLSFLVRLCHGFISRDWIVRIVHVYREANRLADGLANYAFSLPLGFLFLESIPDSVRLIFAEDASGTAIPRQIRM